MNYKWILYSLIISCTLYLSSCSEEVIKGSTNDNNYYPLEVGNYVIYQIDSFIYDDFTMTDTLKTFLVRELVESTFIDAAGKVVYRIERAYKKNEVDNWGQAGFDIWFANIDGTNAEKIEENQRYIKLAFPLKIGKKWKGNIHINVDPINNNDIDSLVESPLAYLDNWDYEVLTIDEPMTINGNFFESTITIKQSDYGIQTDTIGAKEIYAEGIGLIYKDLWLLSTQCSSCADNDIACKTLCFNSSWLEKGEAGFVFRMEILSYGQL